MASFSQRTLLLIGVYFLVLSSQAVVHEEFDEGGNRDDSMHPWAKSPDQIGNSRELLAGNNIITAN